MTAAIGARIERALAATEIRSDTSADAEGLTSAAAAELLARHGQNEPAPVARRALLHDVLRPLGSPIILILIAASGVAAMVGDVADATIIVVMVVLSAALDFVQTYRSSRAADALRSTVAPRATVLRDGTWGDVDRRLLVPGDVVRLTAGDLVPADARLLTARDLHVQQAALTGESMPVEKDGPSRQPLNATTDPLHDPTLIFLGTSVVSGAATAVVTQTGRRTQFGDIAARLATRPPETEFERGLRRFTHLILQTVVFLTLFIALVSIALRRDPLQSLLFAVALAVGLVPEFLPMITTVTLASGAVRMARRDVVVKHLPAIQNLGSMDVLCSDKTGTLTSGDVRFEQALDIGSAPSARVWTLAWLNAHFETGVRSPLDAAILGSPLAAPTGYEKVDEIPFDFERRRLTVVVAQGDARIISTKGAPESVLAVCARYETGSSPRPSATTFDLDVPTDLLDADARARVLALAHEMSEGGQRVLAVAWRATPPVPSYTKADERELTFAGLLTFRDPPLAGAADTVRALASDGVRVVVLSGDEAVITRQVCTDVGLSGADIVTGADVERMSDGALAHVAERATGFARLTPAQKTRVIGALRSRSHVVGFLGDGINDAPALHAADVGISVCTAADVAKDAADVILMKPGLGVLHAGIIEGRTAFGNTMKYLLMGTSSSFGNMFSMAVASIALPFLPMLPTQILLNNFLYDVAQVTIPTDHVDPEYLARPHRWDMRILRAFMLGVGPVSSLFDFLTFFVLLKVFHAGAAAFHTGWFMESLATQTLVLFSIRTVRSPLRSRPSRALAATVLGVVALGLLLPVTPIAGALGFVRMPASFYGFVAGATLLYLALADAVKRPLMRRLLLAAPRA